MPKFEVVYYFLWLDFFLKAAYFDGLEILGQRPSSPSSPSFSLSPASFVTCLAQGDHLALGQITSSARIVSLRRRYKNEREVLTLT